MITEEAVNKILKGYRAHLHETDIAEYAGVSTPTVISYLRKAGLEPRYGRGRPPKMTLEEKILHAHELKLTTREAGLYAGVSKTTIRGYWEKAGLKFHGHFCGPLPKKTIDKICEAHKLKLGIIDAAEYAGVDKVTIQKYWRNAGLEPNFISGGQPLPQETIDKILEAHKLKMSRTEAAEYAGVSVDSVTKYWHGAGLYPPSKSTLSQKTIDKIYKAHKKKMSQPEAAKYAGVSDSTIKYYWKKAGLKSNFKSSASKVALSVLMDFIFDTKNNPNETLTFDEIKARISELRNNREIDDEDLEKKLKFAVKVGIYDVVEENGIKKYKAGMPRAMDGYISETN